MPTPVFTETSKPSLIQRMARKVFGWALGQDFLDPNITPSNDTPVRRTPRVIKKVALEHTGFHGLRHRSFGDFEGPAWDLSEIGRAVDTESIIATSVRKHLSAIMREDWTLKGKNKRALSAVQRRIDEMSLAMGMPFGQIVRNLANDLVQYSNAALTIIRSENNHPRRRTRRTVQGQVLFPIVGVQVIDITTMKVRRDKNGNVDRWLQEISNVGTKEFPPHNIIHIFYNRRTGFQFAPPWFLPALDDIRAYRRMEELAEVVTHKHAFPFFHFKVGSPEQPAEEYDDGSSEIDDVKGELETMPVEGAMVTSHRVEADVVSLKTEAMDLTPMLEYWRRRSLGGVNLSEMDIGIADTANKATAIQGNRNLIEQAKDFQQVLSEALSFYLILQLLEEEGFDLTPENMVFFVFPEIDIERRQAIENHYTDLFLKNVITHDEVRSKLNAEPFEGDQIEGTNLEMFDIPRIEAEAKAKATVAAAAAAARPAPGGNSVANKNRPANQNGRKPARTTPVNDSMSSFERLMFSAWVQASKTSDAVPDRIESGIRSVCDVIMSHAGTEMSVGMENYADRFGGVFYVGDNVKNYYRARCVEPLLWAIQDRLQEIANYSDEELNMARIQSIFDAGWKLIRSAGNSCIELAQPYGWLKAAQIDRKKVIEGATDSGNARISVFDIDSSDLRTLQEILNTGLPVAT